jgi:P27 family predicted phage terminase small subunit
MGRPAKTPESHELAGTRDQSALPRESQIAASRPHCPKFLSPAARTRFRALARELEARRHLTRGDAELLALYASIWTRHRKSMADVESRGEVIISISLDKNGQQVEREKKNPWLVVAQEAERSMVAILDRLGFSPTFRDRIRPTKGSSAKRTGPPIEGSAGWYVMQGGATEESSNGSE